MWLANIFHFVGCFPYCAQGFGFDVVPVFILALVAGAFDVISKKFIAKVNLKEPSPSVLF